MKARAEEPLLDLRGATFPALLSTLVMVPLAFYVGALLVKLEGGRAPLLVLTGVLVMAGGALSVLRTRTRIVALQRLQGRGSSTPAPELLRAALLEAHALPDFQFRVILQSWLGAGVLLAAGLGLFAGEPLRVCLWALAVPAVLGPTAAVLAYVLTLKQTRACVRRIASLGMKPSEVVASLPKRQQLVLRFVLFTLITTATPLLLTGGLGLAHGQEELRDIQQLPLPAQRVEAAARARVFLIAHVSALGLLMGGLALFVTFLAGSAVGDPIAEIADEAQKLAAGEASRSGISPVIPAEDEVWEVAAAFTAMQQRVEGVLGKLREAGTRIGVTSQQILSTSGRYESTANEQAASLNETTATTEELARSAAQIAENAATVAAQAEQTLSSAREGQTHAEAFTRTMERMREDNRSVSQAVHKLSRRVQQIGRIVEFINSIADKSDLLALSAELEGTKAGDVGRGFGLVASEMRRLAENILESTREIEELIREIREATHAAVQATEAGVHATEDGARQGFQVGVGLAEIVTLAQQTTEAVKAISLATAQQQNGTDQLAQSMASILSITEGNMSATRLVATRNAELSEVAHRLKKVVDRFGASEG